MRTAGIRKIETLKRIKENNKVSTTKLKPEDFDYNVADEHANY
jgi:hypothetical protein